MKTIDLGYANGWDKETSQLYKELLKYQIEKSATSKNIGNCLNEYSFESMHENEIVKVIYKIDSSD